MKIKLTEKQIRLIIQESIGYKYVKRYLEPNRNDEIENRLKNIFETLKTNPEYIDSNRNGDRLYFKFIESVYLIVENIIDKINKISDENYKLTPDLFKSNLIEVSYKTKLNQDKIQNFSLIKILSKFVNKIDEFNENDFNNLKIKLDKFFDISRKTDQDLITSNLYVVISKAKYDLAAMSGNRNWKSCMTIPTKENNDFNGGNCRFILKDIKQGTLIAYIIKSDDKNINNPISRMLIKPHFSKNGDVLYKPEDKIYGTYDKDILYPYLTEILTKVNENSKDGFYTKDSELYDDDLVTKIFVNKNLVKSLKQYGYNKEFITDGQIEKFLIKNSNNNNFFKILEILDNFNLEEYYLEIYDRINLYKKLNTYKTYIDKSQYSIKNLKLLKVNNFKKFEKYLLNMLDIDNFIEYFLDENLITYKDKFQTEITRFLYNNEKYLKLLIDNKDYFCGQEFKTKINLIYAITVMFNMDLTDNFLIDYFIENDCLSDYDIDETIFNLLNNFKFFNYIINKPDFTKKLKEYGYENFIKMTYNNNRKFKNHIFEKIKNKLSTEEYNEFFNKIDKVEKNYIDTDKLLHKFMNR